MVNKTIVLRLLGNIEGYLNDLKLLNDIGFSDFKTDIKVQRFTERTLQIMIESMLDITHHIISDEQLRKPNSYADAFTILYEHKILDKDFLETLKHIAQFRNKLVHYYEKVAIEVVYEIATKKCNDIEIFLDSIKSWMN